MRLAISLSVWLALGTCFCSVLQSSEKEPARALMEAVASNDVAAAKLALAQGAPLETRNAQGRTGLILAAQAGALEMAKSLVQHGADVNARTTTEVGSTVLSFAIEGGNLELAAFLIEHGAKVNGKGRNGQTPLHYAAAYGLNPFVELLLDRNADPDLVSIPDSNDNLTTPLIAAAANGHLETVRLLLDRGANLEMTNNAGDTVLMETCKRPYPQMVKLLLERGARVNTSGRSGHTALLYAAFHGHTEIIQQLLAAGADPLASATNAPERAGQEIRYDAADLAQQNGHWKALLLILRAQEQALKAQLKRQWDILS
jgi:uncharacterized protein